MAFSVNKMILLGNLGGDAETRFTQDGKSITKFTLATSRSYKGKDEEWVNETTWHNVVAWGLSDFYKNSLKKGAKVYIEGRISKRDYVDKENIKRYFTEVVAETIIPLDSNKDFTSGGSSNFSGPAADNSRQEPLDNSADNTDLPF